MQSTHVSWRALYVQFLTAQRAEPILEGPSPGEGFAVGFVLRALSDGGVPIEPPYFSVAELCTRDGNSGTDVAQGFCHVPSNHFDNYTMICEAPSNMLEVFIIRKADGKILKISGRKMFFNGKDMFLWDLEGPATEGVG